MKREGESASQISHWTLCGRDEENKSICIESNGNVGGTRDNGFYQENGSV